MYVIGVTGGVGSGKSELLRYIKDHYNCRILMADEASHEVMRPGGIAYEKLVKLLSQFPVETQSSAASEKESDIRLLNPDGAINHNAMAARIFADQGLLEKVNGILHPAVREYILSAIAVERKNADNHESGAVDYFFLEAALLIEGGYNAIVDQMWYIYCDRDVRIQRLKASRGYPDEKIRAIMSAQLSEEDFRNGSDVVIDNSGELADAYRQIDAALKRRSR